MGALLGEAVGAGVGLAIVSVNVSVTTPLTEGFWLMVTVPAATLTEVTVVPAAIPVPETVELKVMLDTAATEVSA